MKYDINNNEEEEGEQFDFDSGDEILEVDRQVFLVFEIGGIGVSEVFVFIGGEDGVGVEIVLVVEFVKLVFLMKVNLYFVIDIMLFQEDQLFIFVFSIEEESVGFYVFCGYLVFVFCGYVVFFNLFFLLFVYFSLVIICVMFLDEEVEILEVMEDCQFNFLSFEEFLNSED